MIRKLLILSLAIAILGTAAPVLGASVSATQRMQLRLHQRTNKNVNRTFVDTSVMNRSSSSARPTIMHNECPSDSWRCTAYSKCDKNFIRKRTCDRLPLTNCIFREKNKPSENEFCSEEFKARVEYWKGVHKEIIDLAKEFSKQGESARYCGVALVKLESKFVDEFNKNLLIFHSEEGLFLIEKEFRASPAVCF